jgi:hypothetical protein
VTQVLEILTELQRRGVAITVEGESLCLKPKRALDAELLSRLREQKPEILAALRNRPAMCAASCYEIEPGRWIHHPWDGCATVPSPRPAAGAQRACKHCDGTGECGCPACTLRRTSEPTPCSMCRWEEHRWWVAATRPET